MTDQPTRRAFRRPTVLLALLLTASAIALVGSDAGASGGDDKVFVCHATASNTNPWVRIEVSPNAVPAHLGQVGNSHQHQQSLGRYDFEWTSDYDEECTLVAPDPITVECSQESEIVPVTDNGPQTPIPCEIDENGHAQVILPIGVHMIQCGRGTAAAPHELSYWLHPGGVQYLVNCLVGDVVDLGIQGGPVQVVCPAEGVVKLYKHGLVFPIVADPYPCTPGELVPNGTTAIAQYVYAIDWSAATPNIRGLIGCPAPLPGETLGILQLFFLGEGPPSTDTQAAVGFPCTPGSRVDVTRLVLTV